VGGVSRHDVYKEQQKGSKKQNTKQIEKSPVSPAFQAGFLCAPSMGALLEV
jgi:hypothetical protein